MTERCEGRYAILGRSEPFDVTYRCGLHAGHSGFCAAARCGARSGDYICDRDANHEGNHRGYNEQIDAPMFWPPTGATPTAPWSVVMDFPTAWAYIREQHPDPKEHDPRCSWVTTKGGILCDCYVLNAEYHRRELAQREKQTCRATHSSGVRCELPLNHTANHKGSSAHAIYQWPHNKGEAPSGYTEDSSRSDHGRDHDGDLRAHQTRSVAPGEPSLQSGVVEGVDDSRQEAIRIALQDLNLHCTDHAPDPDCEGCCTQLAGFRFDPEALLACPDEIAIRVSQRVAEIPDRSSPDDQPEMMLVTSAELQFFVTDEINKALS